MSSMSLKIKNRISLILRILLTIALAGVIIWKFDMLKNLDVRLLIESSSSFPITIATLLGVYLLKGITLVIPASLVYIAIGMSIPIGWALTVNIIGIVIEVSVTYLLGAILGGPFVTKKLKATKYGNKIFSVYESHEKTSVVILRFLPVPIDFCSLFFGAMRVNYFRYLLMSLAGILPRVIVFTILGDKVYGLIPMKYIITVGSIALIVALVVSTVKFLIKSINQEKPAYIPLCDEKRDVILDTDVCTDCDDAGAMALLFQYTKKYNINLIGICNCVPDPYGSATVKAIGKYYGNEKFLLGRYTGDKNIDMVSSFNKKIAKKYDTDTMGTLNEIDFYKKALKDAKDDSVTIITIGMFTNISNILDKEPKLFNKKVNSIVSMAGIYPEGKEFNIEKDVEAFKNVLKKYEGKIIFADFKIGDDIKSGFDEKQENNPVYDCYALKNDKEEKCYNSSFDLIATHYAFEGNGNFYSLTKPMILTVNDDGYMSAQKSKNGKYYFIKLKEDKKVIGEYFNKVLSANPPADNI